MGLIRMIVSRLAIPFIPVGINYSGKRWRKLVRINFGRPIYEGSSPNADDIFDQIMKNIARLSGL